MSALWYTRPSRRKELDKSFKNYRQNIYHKNKGLLNNKQRHKLISQHILNRIRRFLDFNSCHNAVRSLILSKLDYCGALLNGISYKDITRLQRIQIGVPGWFSKNPNALIPLLFLRSSTGCQWPNVFNSAPLFIPSSLWTTSHLTTSPASSMCASHLLTPSVPPLSLVFMFRRHALLLAIEHFHPSTPRIWNNLPAMIRGTTTNVIFFPISRFPFFFLWLLPFFLLSFLFLLRFVSFWSKGAL